MQQAKNLSEYNKELREALDNTFLRGAMDKFATAYPVGRANAFREYEVKELIQEVVRVKDAGISRLDELFAEFKAKAEANGIKVHWAKTADDANEIIARIAKDSN